MSEKGACADGEQIHQLFKEVFSLHGHVMEVIDLIHETAGMTTPQVRVLNQLVERGPATVPHIATNLTVSRQFVQTVCNGLAGIGFIEYEANPHHKRSKLVVMTEKGRAAFLETKKKEAVIIQRGLPDLDAQEVEVAISLLADIRQRMAKADMKGILV